MEIPSRSDGQAGPEGRSALRLAVVTETYPPEINGVAMTVARLVQGLCARGHTVQLVRPRQHAKDVANRTHGCTELLTRGLPIPRYPELKVGLPAGRALEKAWADFRPDAVQVATEGPLGYSAVQIARRLGVPVVSEFRTNFHAYSRHYGIGFLRRPILSYLRGFHNRTACTMVPTAKLAAELAAEGFERLRVVGRGVETSRFHPGRRCAALRRQWNVPDETPAVIAVGRLAPEKNLDLLLAAFARIKLRQPGARLVIVGDGPARASLQARCPDAVFAGRRYGEDLANHYASADLMLFPSLTETFGNVTLEAMASGLGVVAFDYGAAGEHIRTGENGWTAPWGDHEEFMRLAAAAVADFTLIRQRGQAARETAQKMGWDQIVTQVESHHRAAMQSARPAGRPHLAAGSEIEVEWAPATEP